MSIWWNYLIFENHNILAKVTAAAVKAERERSSVPLAFLMVLGLSISLMTVLGMVYMFLRLIRAVQLNLAQSQFIAAVTHELRSPVASLQLMLETIRDPTTPREKRAEFELCMDADLRRLRQLVDQVLDTARLENSSEPPPAEPVPVDAVLKTALDAVDARIKMNAGQLHVAPLERPLLVNVNLRLLTSVLANVLDNAIKYSQGPAEIDLRVSTEGRRRIVIEIADHGVGISRKELKKVFRRFYRSRNPLTRAKPGTGLGLYFSRLALRAQGGDITVTSPGVGQGSTFRIEVPGA
ncbi:MAG: HAMP domain-containing histidine kinase, partial [Deltaproteobacteria bacterium]|nr:HAMP domain-containing histidine kinase [Deltaproteobacteria bacterium]